MSLTRRSFSALSLGALLAPGAARAQSSGRKIAGQTPTVIELFTSQGCSSCPPADALMVELAKERGMIPLTYPVEIWDYLGWRDSLARPAFTRRQRAYAAMVAGKRVYTPQAIINGRAHCVGSDFAAIVRLKAATATPPDARLSLARDGNGWTAAVQPAGSTEGAHLMLLPFISKAAVEIGRGENAGRTIHYANVVRSIVDLGLVSEGGKPFRISRDAVSVDGADGFALIVQSGGIEAPGGVLTCALVDATGIKV